MLKNQIVWIHGDALNSESSLLRENLETPAIFVFDDVLLREYSISLKRLTFIYECLLEMPVIIRRGDVVQEVLHFLKQQGATGVETVYSPSPGFAEIVKRLEREVDELRIYHPPAFSENRAYVLRRFSRYWKKAKASALRPTVLHGLQEYYNQH